MKIIVGHNNMDLDCIGSMVLARYLHPDHAAVRSTLVHPAAKNLLNLYGERLGFLGPADVKGQEIEGMVVVDARSADRVGEFLKGRPLPASISVYDHHPAGENELPGAVVRATEYGSCATGLGLELAERGVKVTPEDATVALTGIYADTGNFTHANVGRADFDAAAYLLGQGASLKLVKDFLVPLKERSQVVLFHEVLGRLESRTIRGHLVQSCYLELEDEAQGLGAVVERVFEVENGEILFGFFFFKPKGKMLVIARNEVEGADLGEILAAFGGGGHRQAASATARCDDGPAFAARVLGYLEEALAPAATAADIMSAEVFTLAPEVSLLAASMFLERINHTGVPIVDERRRPVGMLTLRDIMTGRRAGQMHVPARTFMSRKLVAASPETTVREIDELFFEHGIGHLPVVRDGALVGLVTRSDLLAYKRDAKRRRVEALEAGAAGAAAASRAPSGAALPAEATP